MIALLQLPPALMISQTSTPLLGPRCLQTVSTNSSGMKMTPRLTPKTSWLQKPSPPGKIEFQRPWIQPCLLHPCQYLLLHLHLPHLPSLPLLYHLPHISQLSSHCCVFPINWCITSSSAPEGETTLGSAPATEGALKD